MSTWSEVKSSLESFYNQAARRTDRLARLGLRAYDRYGIHKDLDRQFAALGALTHSILSEGGAVVGDPRVQAALERIAQLQDELRLTQAEMEDLRRQAAAGGTKAEQGEQQSPIRPDAPGAGDPQEPPASDRSSD
jgi:hypothetical protein